MERKLQAENAKLKELLKKAVDGIEFLGQNFGCCGCEDDWQKCPFSTDEKEVCSEHWKYQQEVEELLKGGKTCAEDFYEKFPRDKDFESFILDQKCPYNFYAGAERLCFGEGTPDCEACWNQPVPERSNSSES